MRRETANEQQRPRQFSLAKLLGVITILACVLASWRITGMVAGFTYVAWAAGTLAAMRMFLTVPDKLTSGHWFTFENTLAAPVGGGVAAMIGNAIAGQLVHASADPAQAEFVFPFGFGFLGAMGGLVVGILAAVFAAVNQFALRKTRPEARTSNLGKQVFVFALLLICFGWLLIVAVSTTD